MQLLDIGIPNKLATVYYTNGIQYSVTEYQFITHTELVTSKSVVKHIMAESNLIHFVLVTSQYTITLIYRA